MNECHLHAFPSTVGGALQKDTRAHAKILDTMILFVEMDGDWGVVLFLFNIPQMFTSPITQSSFTLSYI